MSWTVETLNETVDAEVDALPEDMRARLARIAKLIEDKGLGACGRAAREAHRRPPVGNADEGPRWDFSGAVRDGHGSARSDRPGLREENEEDAAA